MVQRLTEAELASRSGTTVERIRRLAELRILRPSEDGRYPPSALARVRLAEDLSREGIPLGDLGRAIETGVLSLDFLEKLLPPPVGLREQSADELAAQLGLTLEELGRLYTSWFLPPPVSGQRVREDDARMLMALKVFPQSGLDTGVLVAATRYFGDNLRRIAQSQVEFFKASLMDPLLESGMSIPDVLERLAPLSAALQPAAQELLVWLHRRQFESHVYQELVPLIENIMDESGFTPRRSVVPPAIAFLDLSGYTRLTEQSGDEAATRLAQNLAGLTGEASLSFGGRVVKTLGDGVMFHFADPAGAILCGLAMVERAERLGLPRARMGVNAGKVVFRDGDYFGRTVNIAARIADYARPGEVLVSESVRDSVAADGVTFREIGAVLLRGVEDPISLFRALPAEASARTAIGGEGSKG